MPVKKLPCGVTRRDNYIIAKALAYAITAIEQTDLPMREVSDASDMRAIFRFLSPDPVERAITMTSVRWHMGLLDATLVSLDLD